MARRVRYVYGNLHMGGVTSVLALDDNGVMIEMTEKGDMEKAIMEKNEKSFCKPWIPHL
jgi:hypothetical protein